MNIRILVVDDELAFRDSLRDILLAEGYQVEVAEDGLQAIQALSEHDYDLVLLDIRMPGMSGIEVLRRIEEISPDTKVILLTAHGTVETAIEALRYGAHDYILKPATSHNILSSVARALVRKAEKQQRKILIDQLESSLKRLKDAEGISYSGDVGRKSIPLKYGIIFDFERREIWAGNQRLSLTPTESKLLFVLADNRGRVISHKDLVMLVQGYEVKDWEAPEVLRPLISRLRRKLSTFPGGEKWIVNVRGSGYLFDSSA
jgi:DNA-binding response OmpR family regulator